jgi:hypothetical protein
MAPEKGHEPKEGPELGISSRDRPSLHLGNLVGVEGDALGSDKVAQGADGRTQKMTLLRANPEEVFSHSV